MAQTEPVRLLQRPFFCRSCQFRTGSELTRSTIFGACQSGTGSLCCRGRVNSGTGSYFGVRLISIKMQFRTGSCESGTGSLCFRGRINSGTGSYFGGTTDFNKNTTGTGSRIRGINKRPRFLARFSKEPVPGSSCFSCFTAALWSPLHVA